MEGSQLFSTKTEILSNFFHKWTFCFFNNFKYFNNSNSP